MAALRPVVGVLAGLALAIVLWNLVGLAVGVVREFDRENDAAIFVSGTEARHERYDAFAMHEDIEIILGWTALAVALLAIPNRHWVWRWWLRGGLQALGAAGTMLALFVLFTHRAEFSRGNLPYTLAWQLPVVLAAAGWALAQAWLSRDTERAS